MNTQRIVIKLGTSVLTAGQDKLNKAHMVEMMRQIAQLMHRGHEVTLVSSGAVLAGWEHLGFPERKRTLAEKQLLAAVGQSQLMHLYTQLAALYDLKVAQTLLTRSDFSDRRRYLNARATFGGCFERNLLPIVNENDVVAIEEIQVGDNDTLAAHVAALVEADQLIICTDIPGLYTAAPQENPDAKLIPLVTNINEEIWNLAGGVGSHHGTGGMFTKIQAADISTRAGIGLRIVDGSADNVLLRAAAHENIGTWFQPRIQKLEARKRWIVSETNRNAALIVDEGAEKALIMQGKSLLAVGIVTCQGDFERGQTLRILAPDGQEIARGLCRYDAKALQQIAGKRSDEIESILGYSLGAVVVRRDDMVLDQKPL